MRRFPSFVLCSVTMLLFLGPALLSVGIPAWPQRGGSIRTAESDPRVHQDVSFRFDIALPKAEGWAFGQRDIAKPSQRVVIVRTAPTNVEQPGTPPPPVQVCVYAMPWTDGDGDGEADPLAADLAQVEASLGEVYHEMPAFQEDTTVDFAGESAVRVTARGPSKRLPRRTIDTRATLFRHGTTFFVYVAQAEDGLLDRHCAELQQIEQSFKLR